VSAQTSSAQNENYADVNNAFVRTCANCGPGIISGHALDWITHCLQYILWYFVICMTHCIAMHQHCLWYWPKLSSRDVKETSDVT